VNRQDEKDRDRELIHGVPRGSDGFYVPEGYFEALPDMVMARLEQDRDSRPSTSARIAHFVTKPAFAYAALITGLLIAVVMLVRSPQQSDVFADISSEAAYAYVYSNIGEYSMEEIADIAGNSAIDEEILKLTDDQVNIALDQLLEDADLKELDELF